MTPKDEDELEEMFRFAVSYNDGPIAMRYPRGGSYAYISSTQDLYGPKISLGLGKAEILKEGKNITILSIGYMSLVSLDVARQLQREDVDCEVINARFIKPLDLELILSSISKTKKLITVEEGMACGGFGSFVVEMVIDKIPKGIIIKNIGLPDKFVEHGKREILLDRYGLSTEKIKNYQIYPCPR
jgi:1-deoxy-D-xylulose-5-phosphate synthase